jgi:hypothetical protein
MAAITPAQLIENYALLASGATTTAEGLFIPLASLAGLTSAEANASTGDGRKVAFELMKEMFDRIQLIAAADRPNRLTITRGIPTGLTATVIQQTYTAQFALEVTGSDVAAEA